MKYRAIYLNLPQRINEIKKQYGAKIDDTWLNGYAFILSDLQEHETRFFKQFSSSVKIMDIAETISSDILFLKFRKSSTPELSYIEIKKNLPHNHREIPQEVFNFFTETAGRLNADAEKTQTLGFDRIDFKSWPVIMGVLNVTPDSFSDGGKFISVDSAVQHALEMEKAGAQIIDIGGESSRPGAGPVSLQEEIERTIPVIRQLRKHSAVALSIDTYKSEVARLALEAGADVVNDISGLRKNQQMTEVVRAAGCPVIIMHMKGEPRNMQKNPGYEDVLAEIYNFFDERIKTLEAMGIKQIILDPGIGFGKRLQDNLKLIRDLKDFSYFGKPVLIGVSRKSFIGRILNKDIDERLVGTVVANTFAAMHGATVLRVHDVAEMQDVKKMMNAILSGNFEN